MTDKKYIFREGDAVAHGDNLETKMFVERILKKTKKEATGRMVDGKPDYHTYQVMLGIVCHWFEDKKLIKSKFHSMELIPWEEAVKKAKEYEKSKV